MDDNRRDDSGRRYYRCYEFILIFIMFFSIRLAVAADTDPEHTFDQHYSLDYVVRLNPDEGDVAKVTVTLGGGSGITSIRFRIDPKRFAEFDGDGSVEADGDKVYWKPPGIGGKLNYEVRLRHFRSARGYDALIKDDWAMFRGEDLVPPVQVLGGDYSESDARLRFVVPNDWVIATAYTRLDKRYLEVEQLHRHMDRPTGWIVAGKIGVRRETIAGRDVAIAGPKGHGVRRQDILAFLNWNLPALVEIFPKFTERLLIVSAGDPMWRGGLSGPATLYIHSERPLISENGTSTLMHELVHVAMRIRGTRRDDWIVEGLAEYYSIEIMRRSGTITSGRYQAAHKELAEWGKEVTDLRQSSSSGALTAKAVGVLRALDKEIRKATGSKASLDDVARQLTAQGPEVSLAKLKEIAEGVAGSPLHALASEKIRGS